MAPSEAANNAGLSKSSAQPCSTDVSQGCLDSGRRWFGDSSRRNEVVATFSDWAKRIADRMKSAPRRWKAMRILGALVFVGMTVSIIPRTPLAGPLGGVIAFTCVLICCWYSGPGISILIPLYITVISRVAGTESKPLIPTPQEMTGVFVMTVLAGLTGLTGQYRRRLRTVDRRHKERLLHQQRALSLARILFRDMEGRITTWSDGAEKLFGWTIAEATGQVIHDLLHTEFPMPLDQIRRELLEQRQWRGELKQRHKHGKELIISAHWILYHGDESVNEGVVEVLNDITTLREAEAKIKESEQRKDLFVATLAHELRNPLAPLRSGLDCLRLSQRASPEDDPILDIMGRQLDHMVRLVDDLLDVSRISTGKVKLRLEPVELSEIVADAIDACRTQIDAAGQLLTVVLPEDPVYLNADSGRLTQVFTNLLQNASKFSHANSCINISTSCSGEQVEIRIKDSGIGIPTAMVPHVFDMFAQVQDVRTRGQSGLGLGLNIVKSLVEMHGGTVGVQSDGPGKGAEFSVRLQRALDYVSLADVDMSRATSRVSESRRVLIVDDNRDAARTLALALSIRGCTCRAAFDGVSGLKEAEGFNPHVFVLDLGMPGMSGFDLARQLRAQSRFEAAVLIAVTGWDKEDDIRESREAGFDHHLAKPVDIMALQSLVEGNNKGMPRCEGIRPALD
jgi:PAS domain S-box-containing protein